ncbi:Sec-independent protein translocase protein TatB [Poseidonibacter lekithochrous]|uniref:Sec-independent protein translocase protein TatB n=1 Tax=Poseidonibacter lekithochrous TaxID=1904463 RepID=UPI0008FC97C7|nr:Sec-independent protein translocase protein TatB [Poseidonibacter lekithochrous]QKJ23266.1 twin arginine translocation system, TatB protein [Poseidonibacter lekithochrous]
MFGMGFMEILLIAVIAIIALGPDKLPTAMVEIAKFIRKFKSGVEDAKSTFDNELNIKEMKEEANKFKAQIEDAKSTVSMDSKVDLGLDDIMNDDLTSDKEEKPKEEKVSFKKKKKKETKKTKTVEETNEEVVENAANKFKVNFDEKKEDNA